MKMAYVSSKSTLLWLNPNRIITITETPERALSPVSGLYQKIA